jgi:predicted acyltransferase
MTANSNRLYSLDALRGFDMFWIMGAEEFIHSLTHVTDNAVLHAIDTQLTHVEWNGFRLYDLIFPLFLFISGVTMPLQKPIDSSNRGVVFRRVLKRGLILIFLGMIYNLHGFQLKEIAEIRFPSVLGRIGAAYIFACAIYLYCSDRLQYFIFAGILISYNLLLAFTSAPNFPMGDLTMEGNFASWIDRTVLIGRLHKKIHDPEGLVSTFPAIATGLLGIFAGKLLKEENKTAIQKAQKIAIFGITFIILAQIWNLWFPINKNLWTSSFVLMTGGCSLLLLALFYFVIDVKGYQKWAFIFSIIGMNSILIYLSDAFINWDFTSIAVFDWLGKLLGEHYYEVVIMFGILALKWLLLWYLYQKKVFLKV